MSAYGFCYLSVIPVRETPSDLSQMTTQLLFGDVFEILFEADNWLQIQNGYDDYVGWIDKKQQIAITQSQFEMHRTPAFTNSHLGTITLNNTDATVVPASSFYSQNPFDINSIHFQSKLNLIPFTNSPSLSITKIALSYLNAPYLWGGKTPFGIDCSGFTQSVFKIAGIQLRRDAWQQAQQGNVLSFLSEAKPGDLLFFDNNEEKIVHVGILLSGNQIIHASGKVRIDQIDHQGIFNSDTKSYSHKLRLIKSFLP